MTFTNGVLIQNTLNQFIAAPSFWENVTIGPFDGYIDLNIESVMLLDIQVL